MHSKLISLAGRLVLGTDSRQRLWLSRTLLAGAVFGFNLMVQWVAVWAGLVDNRSALALTALILFGVTVTYGAIRSGWSLRFADPALTMPQMLFAIVALALACLVNPPMRGSLLMVAALVLMFGAFTLPPHRCRELGWIAIAVFGCAMVLGATLAPSSFVPAIEGLHFALVGAVLSAVSMLAGQLSQLRIDQRLQKDELRKALVNLNELATRDELTGLPNRRYFLDWMGREASRCLRTGTTISLAILDLDHFKLINDTRGHLAGDAVLARFADGARTCLRETDLLVRWGGEEFLFAMPDSSTEEASEALSRLRQHLAQPEFWAGCDAGPVTFSAGVTGYHAPEPVDLAIERADSTMYEAKLAGRDRIVVCSPSRTH